MRAQRAGIRAQPGGWVAFPRTLRDHPVMGPRRAAALRLYIELQFRARYRPGSADLGGELVPLEVGQAVYGRSEAARVLGITEMKVRTAELFLERSGLITRKTTSRGTIVTICNYGTWNPHDSLEQPANSQPIASRSPANSQPIATNEEGKKGRTQTVKEKPSTTPERVAVASDFYDEPDYLTLAEAWNATPGVRRADPFYVLEGLGRDNCSVEARDILELLEGAEHPTQPGESLWSFYRRLTGEWLGSEVEY